MVIDCHVHLVNTDGYIDRLVQEMDRLQIDRVCLLAMQNIKFWGGRAATNDQVLVAFEKYPQRVIPFGFVDLGLDPVTIIDELHMKGFRGLKFTRTRYNYNDDRLMDYYARAAAYNMVLLFHTGTVVRVEEDQFYDVDSSRLRPVYLDRIARKFPTLKIIGAHLGNPWYDEAAMTLFWNPNVYFDLSGSVLKRKDAAWFKDTLWWSEDRMSKMARSKDTHYAPSHPFDRICFGSDVPIDEMSEVKSEYNSLFGSLGLPDGVRARVMGETLPRYSAWTEPAIPPTGRA